MSALDYLESYIASALGRRVKGYGCTGGIILRWEPLGAALCDTLVLLDTNTECWFGLSDLRPFNSIRPLPNRREALYLSAMERVESLTEFRDGLIRDFNKPWPGMEWGKAILGMSMVKALQEAEKELSTWNKVAGIGVKCKISR